MLLLIFPFTFYAANGFWKITKNLPASKPLKLFKKTRLAKAILVTLLLTSIIFGALFMVWPLNEKNEGLIEWGGSSKYVPSTMQTTSIPLRDIEPVKKAYQWLNNNMDNNSALLVHDAFDTWTMLYLNQDHKGYLSLISISNKQQSVQQRMATKHYTLCGGTKQLTAINYNPKPTGHKSNNTTE
jgi:hypothetical protein